MDEMLSERFEEHRPHLRAVAYRMLGSVSEADDAVQDAWLRIAQAETDDVENLRAWLTTVVARVSLNMLRSRRRRREEPFDAQLTNQANGGPDPEHEAVLADSVGLALLVVLDSLTPAERLAFVLHDMFDLPFEEIGTSVERSPAAARQLASRARRRVRGSEPPPGDPGRQRRLVDAYLAATRTGDFEALIRILDPAVVLRADSHAVPGGRPVVLRGAEAVAQSAVASAARARVTEVALVDGTAALVMALAGDVSVVLTFTVQGERISGIDVVADPEGLARLQIEGLDGRRT
ncbi:RNA polymerase, sigma subunit, ECF family [Georgenia satyanarayanai]|uniref:RNA polymerase, sigma subunit, ECF family n=1 Tax=Georgenia satyanarayanai TaxID=860221 RepID=A0A2Y8ZXW0_9MICO|nr:sigma-70 family RNA polymerase sigma factor [Georgenia satyanarayanai]PYG01576.1 RNA polymerase ECF family sigma subunit [Georgenia satyanarayanai]SSA36376.1 RNA polymerase, sigma subunit, ECF family [Georgenia satyanarayanai]